VYSGVAGGGPPAGWEPLNGSRDYGILEAPAED